MRKYSYPIWYSLPLKILNFNTKAVTMLFNLNFHFELHEFAKKVLQEVKFPFQISHVCLFLDYMSVFYFTLCKRWMYCEKQVESRSVMYLPFVTTFLPPMLQEQYAWPTSCWEIPAVSLFCNI